MVLDDLKELDNFKEIKNFIMARVVQNQVLIKLIYYPFSNPIEDEKAVDLENPYLLFDEDSAWTSTDGEISGIHGVLLFKQKSNKILNASIPIVLVDFNTTKVGTSNILQNVYIVFRIIMKGEAIQELANGLNRSFTIAKLIDDCFNEAKIDGYGKVHLQSFQPLSINEQNCGYALIFKLRTKRGEPLDNVNYLQEKYGVDSRESL
jgi:hypothetical protein